MKAKLYTVIINGKSNKIITGRDKALHFLYINANIVCKNCGAKISEKSLTGFFKRHLHNPTIIRDTDFNCICINCNRKIIAKSYLNTKKAKEKAKKTNLEKYGYKHASQSEEIKEKTRQTNIERYEVEYPMQSDEVKKKSIKSCRKNLGVDKPLQSDLVKEKYKKTCLNKFGVENPFQSEEHKNKSKNTLINKFGSLEAAYTERYQKTKETLIRRYQVENAGLLWGKYFFNDYMFDSSWELAFYIYHVDRNHNIKHEPTFFTYKYNNVLCRYYPDFKINGKYYEIKGEQFIKRNSNGKIVDLVYFGESNKKSSAKYKCMKKHNVTIIDGYKIQKYLEYVINKYGEDYLDQFRIE